MTLFDGNRDEDKSDDHYPENVLDTRELEDAITEEETVPVDDFFSHLDNGTPFFKITEDTDNESN